MFENASRGAPYTFFLCKVAFEARYEEYDPKECCKDLWLVEICIQISMYSCRTYLSKVTVEQAAIEILCISNKKRKRNV